VVKNAMSYTNLNFYFLGWKPGIRRMLNKKNKRLCELFVLYQNILNVFLATWKKYIKFINYSISFILFSSPRYWYSESFRILTISKEEERVLGRKNDEIIIK